MISKFRYLLFPDNIYKIVVQDYDGNPYSTEMSGRDIIAHLRKYILLDKQLAEMESWAKPIDIVEDDGKIE